MRSIVVAPAAAPRQVHSAEGGLLNVPEGWSLLAPGDPGLTRRVKAAGPSWTVVEKKGRKRFSQGVWAPAAHIQAARAALEVERSDPSYARRREADARRRNEKQAQYEVDFANAVLAMLRFSPAFQVQARRLAVAVSVHATPVGSGTVARTERIPLERRAAAAVTAWLRHQTTGYDRMRIERVRGRRREVRRELAETSHALLDVHRGPQPHAAQGCPLCTALERLG